MPEFHTVLILAAIQFGLAATPGPNMAYLVSRTMAQGRAAGIVSLVGVNLAMAAVMVVSVAGLSGVLTHMPHLWEAIRLIGAVALLWLAWGYLRPGGGDGPTVPLPRDPPARLFGLGFVTALLNPKVAVLYIAGLPHLIDPRLGTPVLQGLVLGAMQVGINILCDVAIVLGAARLGHALQGRPGMERLPHRLVGGALALVALALAVDAVT
jgi:threonine/homoserine/homoserine lactone efflux protein